jgi:hypothetical protein
MAAVAGRAGHVGRIDNLTLGVERLDKCGNVTPIQGILKVHKKGHVLPRHRLLRKPGGFEGSITVRKDPEHLDQPVAKPGDRSRLDVDRGAAPPPVASNPATGEDYLSRVSGLLGPRR